ncbi:MAG TPA: hypothetical protein PLA50_16735, partial [Bacteroidia bacterium]|nr:hypothetical protein [Bacteroidia bacterium]
ARWPRRTAQPRQEEEDWLRRLRPLVKKWHLWAVAAVLAGVAVLAVHLVMKGRNGEIQPVAAMGEVQAGSVALPYPVALGLGDGRADVSPLPVEDGLFARFHAEKGVYGRDYALPPQPGESVAAWMNLAFPVKERSLLREPEDSTGAWLPGYAVSDSGLPGRHGAVMLGGWSGLTMPRHPGVLPKGFTLVSMVNLVAGDERLFRITPPEPDGQSIHLATTRSGEVAALYRETEGGPETRIAIPWEPGASGVLVYRWDPGREQRLASYPGGTSRGAETRAAVGVGGAAFGTVAIGGHSSGTAEQNPVANLLFEFAVFERVLSDDEVGSLVTDFAKRYFGQ